MTDQMFVYILTNEINNVLYTGVTNDIARRLAEHRCGRGGAFTSRYRVHKLVYYETFGDPSSAIFREKQIKAGSRQKKIDLIESKNPEWKDLSDDWS
jgi:putative endonuclease